MRICVYGAASNEIDKSYIEAVENFGEEMAKRGHSLVFGAGGGGLMGAVARGVHRGGGKIIGIIPSFFRDETIEAIFDKCDELIFTDTMAERKTIMRDMAEAFIALPGGIGTYEEFLETLTLKQLGRHEKPIALLEALGYYEPMDAMLRHTVRSGFMAEGCLGMYRLFHDVDACLDSLEG